MGLFFEKFNYVVDGRFKGEGLYKVVGTNEYCIGKQAILLNKRNVKRISHIKKFYSARVPLHYVEIVWFDGTVSVMQFHNDTLKKIIKTL